MLGVHKISRPRPVPFRGRAFSAEFDYDSPGGNVGDVFELNNKHVYMIKSVNMLYTAAINKPSMYGCFDYAAV